MSLADNISVKDIAKLNHVSASTVQRVLEDSKDLVELNYDWLPLALSFDDFSSKNGSNMSILMINAANHRTIDVIESRQGKVLLKAFYKYSRQARCQVRYVIVDLYPPYRKLIKEAFPNAIVIADPFHVVTQAYRALQTIRIRVMKQYGSDTREYRALKSLWKLVMKNQAQLKYDNYRSRRNFRYSVLSDSEVVERLLDMSDELRTAYDYYQTLLQAMRDRNAEQLEDLLKTTLTQLPEPLQKPQRTLRQHKQEILNQFQHPYSNGIIEGRMNKIKVIKRTAYGYRNFNNFRIRILLECWSVFCTIEEPVKQKKPTIRQQWLATG
ncbi:ISL3 family transposase [Limosilactobacillus fermentum]|nr:ISL3 family transposase [Limosilactobacillus fermentum]